VLRDLAGPQPERVVDLIATLMANRATATTVLPGHAITDTRVRNGFAPILGICARTGDAATTDRALDMLWELGRADPLPATDEKHPVRILVDLGQINPRLTLVLSRAILRAATRWLSEPAGDDDTTTPLGVLQPLVSKEGTSDRWAPDGRSVTLTPYLIKPAAVTDLRAGVRALALEHGTGADLRRAAAAVDLLQEALRGPLGYFGNPINDEEIEQWSADDEATLATLTAIARASGEPLIRLRVRSAVSWTARYDKRPSPAATARSLITEIDQHDEDLLTSAMLGSMHDMVSGGAAYLTTASEPGDEAYEMMIQRHDRERQQAVAALWSAHQEPAAVIAQLAERQRILQFSNWHGEGTGTAVQAVVRQRPEQARALLEALRDLNDGPLDEHVHYVLDEIANRDPAAFLDLLGQLLTDRPTLASGAIAGYAGHDWLMTIPGSVHGLVRGLNHAAELVRRTAIRATAMLLRLEPDKTATSLLPHATATAEGLTQAINEVAGRAHDRWLARLDADARSAVQALQAAIRQVGGSVGDDGTDQDAGGG
jgi:hypothetical protein